MSRKSEKNSFDNTDTTIMDNNSKTDSRHSDSRLMRIKMKAYDSSAVVISCFRLLSKIQPRHLIPLTREESRLRLEQSKRSEEVGRAALKAKKKVEINLSHFLNKNKLVFEVPGSCGVFGLISLKGPIPLPTRRRRYCLLSSPHVNKTAREHYEMVIHKRLLYVELCDKNVIDCLRSADILPGVQVDILYS